MVNLINGGYQNGCTVQKGAFVPFYPQMRINNASFFKEFEGHSPSKSIQNEEQIFNHQAQ